MHARSQRAISSLLTILAGRILFFIFAVLLPLLDFPCCLRLLLLVLPWRLFYCLHCRQLPLVYHFCGILEAPGGRFKLPVADQGALGRSDPST